MNLIFFGSPGSGKGTISNALKSENFIQISTGDILREEINKKSELGLAIEETIAKGHFASNELIFAIIENKLHDLSKLENPPNIIFDGFPRNLEQATKMFEDKNINIDGVVYFDVTKEKVIERITNRWIHKSSGRSYNTITMPPVSPGLDDITHELLTQRADDKIEVINERLDIYRNVTVPAYEFLKAMKVPNLSIDGEDKIENQVADVLHFSKNIANNYINLENKKFKP